MLNKNTVLGENGQKGKKKSSQLLMYIACGWREVVLSYFLLSSR